MYLGSLAFKMTFETFVGLFQFFWSFWCLIRRGHREGGPTARSKNFKTPFFKRYWEILSRDNSNGSRTSPFFSFWNTSTIIVAKGIYSFGQDDNKILAFAQLACQPWPISAKTLDASSNPICWDISKRKKMVRFWTYLSTLMEGISNTFKKTAFWNFLNECSI